MATENPATATQPSRTFRIAGDLSPKLSLLLEVLDVKSAAYLDPLIRRQIENDYAANKKAIDAVLAVRERAARDRDELPEMANDLGEAGA